MNGTSGFPRRLLSRSAYLLFALLVCLGANRRDPLASTNPPLLIQGGRLIDGTAKPPLSNAWILIQGDRIVRVGPAGSFAVPREVRTLHARGLAILPGLIDAHVHLATSGVVSYFFARPQSQAEEVYRRDLHSELQGGVTRVRDLSMPTDIAHRLVRKVGEEPTMGARLTYSGPILTSPGGYGSPYAVQVATPEEGRNRVAELASEGAGVIKIAVTSRTMGRPPLPPMTLEVARAIVQAAHERGLPVAAHVAGATAADLRTAVEAGVDSLEHMPGNWDPLGAPDTLYTTSGIVPEILARHITLVPTLSVEVGETYGPLLKDLTGDPSLKLRLTSSQLRLLSWNLDDFAHNTARQAIAEEGRKRVTVFLGEIRKLHAAGVPLVAGSDAGNGLTFHGNLHTEIELLQEGGLSAMEAIQSATRESARLLGVGGEEGTVEAGKRADLLLVSGDPLEDLRTLRAVKRVVIAGRVVDVGRLVKGAARKAAVKK